MGTERNLQANVEAKTNPVAAATGRIVDFELVIADPDPLGLFGFAFADLLEIIIRDTTTTTGLQVTASLLEGVYQTGKRVTTAVMKTLHVEPHVVCPRWTYTLRPRVDGTLAS